MNITTIFFDLDDTLYDQQKPFEESFRNIFQDIPKDFPIETVYKRSRYYSDLLWDKYIAEEIGLKELRIQRIKLALKEVGMDISDEKAHELQQEYYRALNSIQVFEEVPKVLQQLKNNGFQVGIITNGPVKHQYEKIQALGLTQFIPDKLIFISDAVGVAKPDPQIFHRVSTAVKCDPSKTIYVGDSWRNDIVGSNLAGWHSLWYNHRKRKPETEHKPLLEIENLLEILTTMGIKFE